MVIWARGSLQTQSTELQHETIFPCILRVSVSGGHYRFSLYPLFLEHETMKHLYKIISTMHSDDIYDFLADNGADPWKP